MGRADMLLVESERVDDTQDDDYADDFVMEDEESDGDKVFAADDGSTHSESTNLWDRSIAALQGMLMDKDFDKAHRSFCRQHCHQFEEADENKLSYMHLFEAYCALLEGSIQQVLQAAVPGLSMDEFAAMLSERQGQLGAEVLDMLLGMSDFTTFKDLMLEARRQQEDSVEEQQLLDVFTCSAVPLHAEEQEDGEQRPDLNFCSLSIAPLASAAATVGQAGAQAESKAARQACPTGNSHSGAAAPTVKQQAGATVMV